MTFSPNESYALALDADDKLAAFRSRFHIPTDGEGRELIYFVGHSLGLQPHSVRAAIEAELSAWANLGVDAHFRGSLPWTQYGETLAPLLAPVVGGNEDEVILMNALTVNLHHMMISFYRPGDTRFKILMEEHAFPSDRYAVASQCVLHGYDPASTIITVRARPGEHTLRDEDIESVIQERGSEIALVLLGGVNYYTGQLFDLERIARAGRDAGCVVGFDLAHAAGNVELKLHDWDVDFAVWCCYKYLNSGPGSLSGCFVHQRHFADHDIPRLKGWWGEGLSKRFQMHGSFEPMHGAGGWQISNPNVLSLASIRASLALFHEAGLDELRHKQRRLTSYVEYLLDHHLRREIEILTPADAVRRGSQLSLMVHDDGRAAFDRLRENGVVCDWRNPNVIRVAPVPLYNTFHEVWRFVNLMRRK
ncbi:MAG: kynureninase [Rhodothermales bacterium]|nr:kynureninase [Rhodothermales bacterium]